MKKEKDILDHLRPEKINTPDNGFFEALASKIAVEHPTTRNRNRILPRVIGISFAAAAVLIIAVVLFKDFSQPVAKTKVEKALFADINDDEIYAYVDEHLDDFSIEEIEECFSSEELVYDDIESGLDLFSDISQDEIMNYIENENIDLDEFEDELLIF